MKNKTLNWILGLILGAAGIGGAPALAQGSEPFITMEMQAIGGQATFVTSAKNFDPENPVFSVGDTWSFSIERGPANQLVKVLTNNSAFPPPYAAWGVTDSQGNFSVSGVADRSQPTYFPVYVAFPASVGHVDQMPGYQQDPTAPTGYRNVLVALMFIPGPLPAPQVIGVAATSPTPTPTLTPTPTTLIVTPTLPVVTLAAPATNPGAFITAGPLATYLSNWVSSVENVSILSLVNEGITGPDQAAAEVTNQAVSFCTSQQNVPAGCSTLGDVVKPFAAQVFSQFSLVPASQWNPATFTIHLPVYAAAFSPAPPAPVAQTPLSRGTTMVGACSGAPGQIICLPGPGANFNTVSDGTRVIQGGVIYVAHIAVTMAGMGQSLTFSPLFN